MIMSKNTEIERKFLVISEAFKAEATGKHEIMQGYLCREREKTIRVRISDDKAYLTIKSSTLREGIERFEWEREIEVNDAKELLQLCQPPVIIKTRYIIPIMGSERKWEVDVFHGHKEGLVLAEIELGSAEESFDKPAWLGEDVTGDPRYYNANM